MKLPLPFAPLFCAAGALALFASTGVAAEDFYVGTYTHFFGSKGIYHFQFDPKNGAISGGELAVKTVNPSFLAIHPNRRWLYAVHESKKGSISAFTIAPDGQLQLLDSQDPKGGWPCHVTLDASHRDVLVANYLSGTVAVLPIQNGGGIGSATGFAQQQGKGPNADRQEGPHAHSIYTDPANRYVYSCDLGNDRVEGYRFHPASGTITPSKTATASIAAGSGPRHLVLSPHGFVYVINELSRTITVLRREPETGAMRTLQTVPSTRTGEPGAERSLAGSDYMVSAAEIALHPNGKFLYASNRGLNHRSPNTIAVFSIADDGRLTFVQEAPTRGRIPRNFALDPSGRWLLAANQESNDIFVFGVNSRTGKLTPAGGRSRIGAPACVAFMPPR